MEMPKKMVENVSEGLHDLNQDPNHLDQANMEQIKSIENKSSNPSAKISDGENKAKGGGTGSMETAPDGRYGNVSEKIMSLNEKSKEITSDLIDSDTVEGGVAIIVETPPTGGNGDGSHEAKETITGSFTELLLAPLGDVHDHLEETSQTVQEVVATEAQAEAESDDTSDEGNTWYIHESDIVDMTSEDVESYDGDDEQLTAQVVVGSGNVTGGGVAVGEENVTEQVTVGSGNVTGGGGADDDEHITEQVMVESEKATDVGVAADGEHVTKQAMVGSGNVTSGGVAANHEHVMEQVMVESEKVTDVGVSADDEHVVVGSAIVSGGGDASVGDGEDGQPPKKKMRLEDAGNGSTSGYGGSASGYGNGLGNGNARIARANVISTVSATSGNGVQVRMMELQKIRIFGVDMHQYVEVDPESGQRGFRILSIDGGVNQACGSFGRGGDSSSSPVVGSSPNGGVVGSGRGGSASGAGGSSRGRLPSVPRPNNTIRFPWI